MADDFQDYDPSTRITSVANLLGNHYKFVLTDLPDLTFFVQQVVHPSINIPTAKRGNPFTQIPEVGDHIDFSPLVVHYIVDAQFKSYFSMWYWMRGYGFPTDYQELTDFATSRTRKLSNPIPTPRDIQKTHAQLVILKPDTDSAIATIDFEDVFPITLGELSFSTTEGTPPLLTTQVTFAYTDFYPTLVT